MSGILWVTWRQHRWMIGLVAGFAVVLATVAALAGGWQVKPLHHHNMDTWAILLPVTPTFFGVIVAVFWAAPLISREYEQRTHLVAWGQDVSPARWLTGKALLIALVSTAAAVALAIGVDVLLDTVNSKAPGYFLWPPFDFWGFEANPFVQTGHMLFGLAAGLAASVVLRRSLPAMAMTAAVAGGGHVFAELFGRGHYLPPLYSTGTLDAAPTAPVPDLARVVSFGYTDAAGAPMDMPSVCERVDRTACLLQHGGVGRHAFYQPLERLFTFQLIEFGIFAALAAALFWFALSRVRRAG